MTNEEIKKYYHGPYRFEQTEDGYMYGIHYDEQQQEYLKFNDAFYERTYFSNANTLEFVTQATEVSFDYKFRAGVNETLDLAINDIVIESHRGKDLPKEGKITFSLPSGKKNVTIYLTADDVTYIKNLEINSPAEPITKDTKVLWMGDSITQGYGTFKSCETYVSVANRALKYEVLNQGIGGYYFDAAVLKKLDNFTPDKIIIAHGTNQFMHENREEKLVEYFKKLSEIYPGVPTLVITPLWRNKFVEDNIEKNRAQFLDFCEKIKSVASSYSNISVVDGFTLLHHDTEFFLPDALHPNALGGEMYGRRLVEEIRKIGF